MSSFLEKAKDAIVKLASDPENELTSAGIVASAVGKKLGRGVKDTILAGELTFMQAHDFETLTADENKELEAIVLRLTSLGFDVAVRKLKEEAAHLLKK